MAILESKGSAYILIDELHKNPEQIGLVILQIQVVEDDIALNATDCDFAYIFLCN